MDVAVQPRRPARRAAAALAAALALVLAAGLALVAPPAAGAAPPAGWEQDMLGQVNSARAAEGRAPLSLCANLNAAAQGHSNYMDAIDSMQHEGAGGSNPVGRAEQAGYLGWTDIGENVAYTGGSSYDIALVMGLWMGSTGHRANILNPSFTHLGVGATHSASDDAVYWTQNFGAGGTCGSTPPPPPPPPPPGPFTDVPQGHPFYGPIVWLVDEGIATGYGDGSFGTTLPVSRQAMAAFLHRASGSPPASCDAGQFHDVGTGNPFCAAITWLAAQGIAQGYPDGGFHPAAPVSRQAMAAFLHRHAGSPPSSCDAGRFHDVGTGNPFCAAITWLAAQGITQGYPDGGFHPAAPVSRQAMAAFLHRHLGPG